MKYLLPIVLFAVACNQSQKVEQGFVVMNKGLEESQPKVPNITIDSAKHAALYNTAKQVILKADSACKFIYNIKLELIRAAEGDDTDAIADGKIILANVVHKDDYDTPTKMMVDDGKGRELKNTLYGFKKYCEGAFTSADKSSYADSLIINVKDEVDPEEPEITTWEQRIFDHTPLAAAIAHLSKLDNDVRHDEAVAIRYLNAKAK